MIISLRKPTVLFNLGQQASSASWWCAGDDNKVMKLLSSSLNGLSSATGTWKTRRSCDRPQSISLFLATVPYMIGSPRTVGLSTAVSCQASSDLRSLCYLCILLCMPGLECLIMDLPFVWPLLSRYCEHHEGAPNSEKRCDNTHTIIDGLAKEPEEGLERTEKMDIGACASTGS